MILIAPDKFKGTYTSQEMCRLMSDAVRHISPETEIVCRPLSDGGEGFSALKAFIPEFRDYALLESSAIVGHGSYPPDMPLMLRSSYALGAAVHPGVPTIISVGGTGVSDGGAGFLQALGVRFYDRCGRMITEPLSPATIPAIASADISCLADYNLTGVIDVRATLTGPGLSALDFARQKAIAGEDLSGLKHALSHLQKILGGESEFDGAGGGLGYALASVAGARCTSGAQLAVSLLDPILDSGQVDLVITGEGCVDHQTTAGGKLPDAVYRAASARSIPTLIVGGRIDVPEAYPLMCTLNELPQKLREKSFTELLRHGS